MCPRQAAGHPHNQIPIKEGEKLPKKSTKRQQKRSITCKQRDNADGARTVFSVQTQSGIGIYYRRAQRGVMRRVKQSWADMWRENKPGFFILSILFLALFWSIGYFIYSTTTGRFVVTVEKISKKEGFDLNVRNVLKVYCREFSRECAERGKDQVEKDIRLALARILIRAKTLDAKITYRNNTRHPIQVNRFLYRTAPGPWRGEVGSTQNRYAPKLQRLRYAIEMSKGNVPFETKVDYTGTLALVENAGSFMIQPGEEKFWRIGYTDKTEVKIEYLQNGEIHQTPALRPR